jgi:hypothetical protein
MGWTLAVGTRRIAGALRLAAVLLAGCCLSASCGDSTTAPSGSTLTLVATPASVGFNGTSTIVADLRQGNGQPVDDGTLITFAATLGSVQPGSAESLAGKATVTFIAGAESGMAVVTAASGSQGSVRVAVGAAAAAQVNMTAMPAAVPFNGGTSTISAVVLDATGKPLSSVPVAFTTTAGAVTPSAVKSDPTGVAQAVLTTNRAASVTAVVGASGSADANAPRASVSVGLAPQPVPIVSFTASENPTMNQATTFTISAAPAANGGAAIQNVTINFGDGSRALDLGTVSGPAIVAQHVYTSPGPFTVTVRATDTAGGTATATTVIVVAAQAPLSVVIAVAPPVVVGANAVYTFIATTQPPTVVIASYVWEFGDGSAPQTTTSAQVIHSFVLGAGPFSVKVTVTSTPAGQTADAFTIINPVAKP